MALTGTKALIVWCQQVTQGYRDVEVRNMTSSWRDGLAFCAILHHYRPDLLNFDKLAKENIAENNHLAFTVAEQELGIPALLDVEDMVELTVPDKLSIMTYISQYYQYFRDKVPGEIPKRHASKRQAPYTTEDLPKKKATPGMAAAKEVIGATPNPTLSKGTGDRFCANCGKAVYLMERLQVEGKLFHRICFTCTACESQLRMGTYRYIPTEERFYCDKHYRQRTTSTSSEDVSKFRNDSHKHEQDALKNLLESLENKRKAGNLVKEDQGIMKHGSVHQRIEDARKKFSGATGEAVVEGSPVKAPDASFSTTPQHPPPRPMHPPGTSPDLLNESPTSSKTPASDIASASMGIEDVAHKDPPLRPAYPPEPTHMDIDHAHAHHMKNKAEARGFLSGIIPKIEIGKDKESNQTKDEEGGVHIYETPFASNTIKDSVIEGENVIDGEKDGSLFENPRYRESIKMETKPIYANQGVSLLSLDDANSTENSAEERGVSGNVSTEEGEKSEEDKGDKGQAKRKKLILKVKKKHRNKTSDRESMNLDEIAETNSDEVKEESSKVSKKEGSGEQLKDEVGQSGRESDSEKIKVTEAGSRSEKEEGDDGITEKLENAEEEEEGGGKGEGKTVEPLDKMKMEEESDEGKIENESELGKKKYQQGKMDVAIENKQTNENGKFAEISIKEGNEDGVEKSVDPKDGDSDQEMTPYGSHNKEEGRAKKRVLKYVNPFEDSDEEGIDSRESKTAGESVLNPFEVDSDIDDYNSGPKNESEYLSDEGIGRAVSRKTKLIPGEGPKSPLSPEALIEHQKRIEDIKNGLLRSEKEKYRNPFEDSDDDILEEKARDEDLRETGSNEIRHKRLVLKVKMKKRAPPPPVDGKQAAPKPLSEGDRVETGKEKLTSSDVESRDEKAKSNVDVSDPLETFKTYINNSDAEMRKRLDSRLSSASCEGAQNYQQLTTPVSMSCPVLTDHTSDTSSVLCEDGWHEEGSEAQQVKDEAAKKRKEKPPKRPAPPVPKGITPYKELSPSNGRAVHNEESPSVGEEASVEDADEVKRGSKQQNGVNKSDKEEELVEKKSKKEKGIEKDKEARKEKANEMDKEFKKEKGKLKVKDKEAKKEKGIEKDKEVKKEKDNMKEKEKRKEKEMKENEKKKGKGKEKKKQKGLETMDDEKGMKNGKKDEVVVNADNGLKEKMNENGGDRKRERPYSVIEEREMSLDDIGGELKVIEQKQRILEEKGVKMEKRLREQLHGEPEDDYMITWFDLVTEKNKLLRRENELIYMSQEIEYHGYQKKIEFELRLLMEKDESLKTKEDRDAEEQLLDQLVNYVSRRNRIVEKIEHDRIREREEDEQLQMIMQAQGLRKQKKKKPGKKNSTGKATFYT